jgi:hypothetical protein
MFDSHDYVSLPTTPALLAAGLLGAVNIFFIKIIRRVINNPMKPTSKHRSAKLY